jgi:hypothetical protein
MRERPILFSTPMVQALLEGRKTQTRRIVNFKKIAQKTGCTKGSLAYSTAFDSWAVFNGNGDADLCLVDCPYGKVGDILWVRESFADESSKGEYKLFIYKASDPNYPGKWKPSIHMPKAACRIWQQNEEVRVERLHDISEEDAIAEGVLFYDDPVIGRRYKDYEADASGYGHPDHDYPTVSTARESYFSLWRKINGVASYEANDWVWVIKSKVLSTTGKPTL